jgi:hypothetical protein
VCACTSMFNVGSLLAMMSSHVPGTILCTGQLTLSLSLPMVLAPLWQYQ